MSVGELLSSPAEVGYDRMSIDAIAARAGVGKPNIYRCYKSKEKLVADAIERLRQDVIIPKTGSFWGDIEALIQSAAQITLTPLGRQTVAMIISSATSNPQFAQVYWTNYLLYNLDGKRLPLSWNEQKPEMKLRQRLMPI